MTPNQVLQQTAAAIPVPRDITAQRATAAAERGPLALGLAALATMRGFRNVCHGAS
jgi:hypothetical protein